MDPFLVIVGELFSLGIEASDGEGMVVDEADFVPQISAFIHDW